MAMSKQLSMSQLKLQAEPRQELIDSLKLQVCPQCLTAQESTTNNGAGGVKLTPNSRTLSVELINSGVSML
jgi:hypothetical protein